MACRYMLAPHHHDRADSEQDDYGQTGQYQWAHRIRSLNGILVRRTNHQLPLARLSDNGTASPCDVVYVPVTSVPVAFTVPTYELPTIGRLSVSFAPSCAMTVGTSRLLSSTLVRTPVAVPSGWFVSFTTTRMPPST